jgi:dGTPase
MTITKWTARRSDESRASSNIEFTNTIDRSRLVHSAAFRRLQGKTQVMGVGENDFFRTRLTHSLEVAQIGIRINQRIRWFANQRDEYQHLQSVIASDALIETACLAHDIGHPAFGHNGEKILNYYMAEYGGFEGNGQTLRILSRLGEYSDGFGYDMSRRAMLAVLKYPVIFSHAAKPYAKREDILPRNLDAWTPPKCIHDDEKGVLNWIIAPFSQSDRERLQQTKAQKSGWFKSQFKSFDTSIMELADDIAYGIHDLEDAIAMGLLHPSKVIKDLEAELIAIADDKNRDKDYFIKRIASEEPRQLKQAITNMVRFMVENTVPEQQEGFEHELLKNQVVMRPHAKTILEKLKHYVLHDVILQPRLKTMEYKGQKIISELFEAFLSDPKGLLPKQFSNQIKSGDEASKHRIICDYIASMTDSEASGMYERLYLPGVGSVFEPV